LNMDLKYLTKVSVNQFFGIEYDEFASKIAETAMWLVGHQMNMKLSEEFGQYFVKLPLKESAKIVYGNALSTEWESVISNKELNYIIGNPPFLGSSQQSK